MANLDLIKQLREQTGAGVVDARNALKDSGDVLEEAIKILRKKGQAKALKKASRAAAQGIIETYVHGARVGVMVELLTETDFVARNEKFKELAHELALHISATDPKVVKPEDVPAEALKAEREVAEAEMKGKPAAIVERAVAGKLKKFAESQALLTQPWIKNPEETVKDLITRYVTHLGENIQVGRFVRLEIGKE
jgi:elongation factor Ts